MSRENFEKHGIVRQKLEEGYKKTSADCISWCSMLTCLGILGIVRIFLFLRF